VHVDRDVEETDPVHHRHVLEVLGRVLRAHGHVPDPPSADQGALGGDHGAGGEAEVRNALGNAVAQLGEQRLEGREVRGREAAADEDPVGIGERSRRRRLVLGQSDDALVDGACQRQLGGEPRGMLSAVPVAHDDDGDPRCARHPPLFREGGCLGHEEPESGSVSAPGTAADQVHTHRFRLAAAGPVRLRRARTSRR
jgi:hypothetical protein